MKLKVCIGRLTITGSHRQEIANWLVEVTSQALTDPELNHKIEDVLHIPISQCPTSVARNKLVKTAQDNKVDLLFMVDEDATPPDGFFKMAFNHLTTTAPSVIAAPYVCGGWSQTPQVFEWQSPNNNEQPSFALRHISREEAARRTGIEEVANIGTHLIAYNMRVFDKIKPPYYEYEYNSDHTKVESTEEVYCHRRLWMADVKLYCAWDYWATHHKLNKCEKPYALTKKDIDEAYLTQAKTLGGDDGT